jgi:hypothetical protein
VTSLVVTAGFSVPLSLRLGIDCTRVIVSVAVTAYCWAPARAMVSALMVPSIWAT